MLEMTYLVDHLTTEAAWYMRGVTVPSTAWALLEKRYGDRRLVIMTNRHQLVGLVGPGAAPCQDLPIGG